MKYSILGFNQQKIIEQTTCDLQDLLLLNYIIHAQANPKMKHVVDESDQSYVWLKHSHIIEDLPILQMAEGALRNRLTKLKKQGLIDSITTSAESGKGSRTYYSISAFCADLIFDHDESIGSSKIDLKKSTSIILDDAKTLPGHSKYASDNKLIDDREVSKIVSKDTITDPESFLKHYSSKNTRSQNLYSKCVSQIHNFTNDKKIQNALLDYLEFRLEKGRAEGKPLYANMWKGMLNKLSRDFKEDQWLDIINQSIEGGWMNFYSLRVVRKSKYGDARDVDPAKMNDMTKEEKKALRDRYEREGRKPF